MHTIGLYNIKLKLTLGPKSESGQYAMHTQLNTQMREPHRVLSKIRMRRRYEASMQSHGENK
jgi:hypothetical protein